jgi:hypothetical protein
LNVSQLQGLLRDAGLSNIAEGITSQRDAANVAGQLLKLSQGLERNQGRLGREQLQIIERLLGQELQRSLDGVTQRFNQEFERLVGRIPGADGETPQQFRERRARQEQEAAVAAAKAAVENLPAGVFKEAAKEAAAQLGETTKSTLKEQNEKFLADLKKEFKDFGVKVEGEAKVAVEAKVTNLLKVDQATVDAFKKIFPGKNDREIKALLETVGALVKAERKRGTPLPASAGTVGTGNSSGGSGGGGN